MAYKLVIDPETKEEKYEWVDKTESSAGQKVREETEANKDFSYKEAAKTDRGIRINIPPVKVIKCIKEFFIKKHFRIH